MLATWVDRILRQIRGSLRDHAIREAASQPSACFVIL